MVYVFDTADGTLQATLLAPHDTILHPQFSSDGSTFSLIGVDVTPPVPFATANLSLTMLSWETATWREQPPCPIPGQKEGSLFFLAPDCQAAIIANRTAPELSILDLSDDDLPATPLLDRKSSPNGTFVVWFSGDGQTIVRARSDMVLEFWDLKTRRLRSSLRGRDFPGYESWIVTPASDPRIFIAMESDQAPTRFRANQSSRRVVRAIARHPVRSSPVRHRPRHPERPASRPAS